MAQSPATSLSSKPSCQQFEKPAKLQLLQSSRLPIYQQQTLRYKALQNENLVLTFRTHTEEDCELCKSGSGRFKLSLQPGAKFDLQFCSDKPGVYECSLRIIDIEFIINVEVGEIEHQFEYPQLIRSYLPSPQKEPPALKSRTFTEINPKQIGTRSDKIKQEIIQRRKQRAANQIKVVKLLDISSLDWQLEYQYQVLEEAKKRNEEREAAEKARDEQEQKVREEKKKMAEAALKGFNSGSLKATAFKNKFQKRLEQNLPESPSKKSADSIEEQKSINTSQEQAKPEQVQAQIDSKEKQNDSWDDSDDLDFGDVPKAKPKVVSIKTRNEQGKGEADIDLNLPDEEDDTISGGEKQNTPLKIQKSTIQKANPTVQMEFSDLNDDECSQNAAQSDASCVTSSSMSKLKSTSTQGIPAQDALAQDLTEQVKQWKEQANEYYEKYGIHVPDQKVTTEIKLGISALK